MTAHAPATRRDQSPPTRACTRKDPGAAAVWLDGNREIQALADRLMDLADDTRTVPCGDLTRYHLWTSETLAERTAAAELCAGCPVFAECHAAASACRVSFGVWAGRDRTGRRPAFTTTKPLPATHEEGN